LNAELCPGHTQAKAPSAKTFWLNAWKAASVSGASSRRFLASSVVEVGYIPSDIVISFSGAGSPHGSAPNGMVDPEAPLSK
jgi:hypothetical protein